MRRTSLSLSPTLPLVLLATIIFAGSAVMASGTTNIIYDFQGGPDGQAPYSNLIVDKSANLYGMTVDGGANGWGAVFELSPVGAGWSETVLYSFQGGSDGAAPWSGLLLDAAGNLYGTTAGGGGTTACEGGCGTVFELSPPSISGGACTETILYRFQGGGDGSGPWYASLIFDKAGNLYGTTRFGGTSGLGTVFELTPPTDGSSSWTETILHTFTGSADGASPLSGVLLGKGGILYGTTWQGGLAGAGTIYRLTPQGNDWTYRTLYRFKGYTSGSDGAEPQGALVQDKDGNLFGTTVSGSSSFTLGTVFEVTLPTAIAPATETVLYGFKGASDGAYPVGAVVFDPAGNLYGTTNGGEGGPRYRGTVYKLAPPTASGGAWTETVLNLFEGTPQGGIPNAGLVFGKAGSLYGTTAGGGVNSVGVVFRTTP